MLINAANYLGVVASATLLTNAAKYLANYLRILATMLTCATKLLESVSYIRDFPVCSTVQLTTFECELHSAANYMCV
eukprot:3666292-Amphidinium_carterae.2